ncbi:TauD/TfdA dioxygenase family protein [Actinokineospora sp. NPDC004072]
MTVTELLTRPTGVTITRLAGNIGAEIGGVDTSGPLSDETVAEVRAALLAHKVVFLRDQDLNYDTQKAFAERLGELTLSHPIYSAPERRPALREMDSKHGTKANHWHTDLTFIDRPPAFCLLHAKVIPPLGGDTIWANCATAYQSLPPELRDLADRLRVVHSNDSDFTSDTVDHRGAYIEQAFEAEHPAVRVHPETGERTLLLGGFARSVVGMSASAGRDILRALQEYVTRPEQTVRWKWRVGDLAIWDNQATMHYAIYDYGTEHRRGERLTTIGQVPVGVDGRPSVALSGDATAYSAGLR